MFKKYRKMKLVLSLLLMILMTAGFQKNEALANTSHSIGDVMDLTGILNDENGNSLIHNKYVSRAEFARLLVQASEYSGKVSSQTKLKLFTDVKKDNKYSPYIQIAVTNSYMNGYLNGKFKPDKAVTVKESIYGILALLGYSNSDFNGQMSDARLNKFNELGLNKSLNLASKSKITKSDCEILFYNLLHAKQKAGDFYGKSLGYTFDSNNRIDYEALFAAKTKGPVVTMKGWSKVLSNKLSTYTVFEDNKKIKASAINENSIAYYAEQAHTIWIFGQKIIGKIDNITYLQGAPQDITISGTTYMIESNSDMKDQLAGNHIKKGSRVALFLGRNDLASHVVPIQSMLAGSGWEKKLSFPVIKGTIYINNNKAKASDIKNEDVLYYADELKTVWAFHKRIFGALSDMTINETEADTLNVSGTSYYLEDSKKIKEQIQKSMVKNKMPVVLLLGWDDKVYNILTLSSTVAQGDWLSKLTFNPSSKGTIYKDGADIALGEIKNNDIVYYSNELQTLWVYDKKVYGVLKSMYPNSSSPESVVVAGKTFTFDLPPVNTSLQSTDNGDNFTKNAWGDHLKLNGIDSGDNVVVLFGFNGYVADIVPIDKMPISFTGFVLKVDNQLVKSTDSNSNVKLILTMVDTEGLVREFPCSDNSMQAGTMIEVDCSSSQPAFHRLDSVNAPSDLPNRKFAKDANILEVKNTYYAKLPVYQMSDVKWGTSDVLYYKCNSAGEITDLILKQVSGSFYQYGLLKSAAAVADGINYGSVQYVFSFGASDSTYISDAVIQNPVPGPKAALIVNNQLQEMHDLTEVPITYISQMQANTGSTVYWIADDVTVYFYKSGKYYTGSLDDINSFSNNAVKGYRDSQGPIRIIIVTV